MSASPPRAQEATGSANRVVKIGFETRSQSRAPLKVKKDPGADSRTIRPEDVLRRLASLRTMDVGELKSQWRKLFDREPPPYNRRFLESRLAYRIQELAYGGLSAETVRRLETLGEQLDGGDIGLRKRTMSMNRPVTGTRLVREWQGEEYQVTVTADGFEWSGRPYKSLSAIATAITGTKWNGLVFFGLKSQWRAEAGKRRRSQSDGGGLGSPPSADEASSDRPRKGRDA